MKFTVQFRGRDGYVEISIPDPQRGVPTWRDEEIKAADSMARALLGAGQVRVKFDEFDSGKRKYEHCGVDVGGWAPLVSV